MTSQPIRLSTNFMTLIPSLTFTDYEWFPWSICNGCGMPAGNAYPSGHLIPSPILGLANAPIVETKFLELAMYLLDFSHRIPLGTFSILLHHICFSGRHIVTHFNIGFVRKTSQLFFLNLTIRQIVRHLRHLQAKKKYRGMFETQKVRRHDKFRKEWSQH